MRLIPGYRSGRIGLLRLDLLMSMRVVGFGMRFMMIRRGEEDGDFEEKKMMDNGILDESKSDENCGEIWGEILVGNIFYPCNLEGISTSKMLDQRILDGIKNSEVYGETVIPWTTWEDMMIPFEKDKTPDDGILEDNSDRIYDEMILIGGDGTLEDESENGEICQSCRD
jgi:hypothetical protein